jgi:hypothetical protein
MADNEKKGGKVKKLFTLLATIGGVVFFIKKRKGQSEPGWDEANPPAA